MRRDAERDFHVARFVEGEESIGVDGLEDRVGVPWAGGGSHDDGAPWDDRKCAPAHVGHAGEQWGWPDGLRWTRAQQPFAGSKDGAVER